MTQAKVAPQNVTRFYGNLDYALDVIANQQITFVHSTTLNDPFDPYFFFETDFEGTRKNLLYYVMKNYPKDVSWFKQCVTAEVWSNTHRSVQDHMEYSRNTTFVFSTSSEIDGINPRNNLYMWGHYANGHRGVAIEFDTRALAEAASNQSKTLPEQTPYPWFKIEYMSKFTLFTADSYFQFLKSELENAVRGKNASRSVLESHIELMARVKSDVWKFENEWRLMWRNDETRMKFYRCPIPENAITSVALGMKLGENSRRDFTYELQKNFPKAHIFQAKKQFGNFALTFAT